MADIPGEPYILSGDISTRLRSFCTSQSWGPTDLDDYAVLLQTGSISAIKADFLSRVADHDVDAVRTQLMSIVYGPTKMPIFNFLLQLTILNPTKRFAYLSIVKYLALEVKVPVDSRDLSGNTAFMYAISTKPYWDAEFATFMIEAGAEVNHRNRYGCTAAHDIVMARDFTPAGKKKTIDALRYFIDKGGDISIEDGDGVTAKKIAESVVPLLPELKQLLVNAQIPKRNNVARVCGSCAQPGSTREFQLRKCAKCQTVLYCSRDCQKNDWKMHKKICATFAVSNALSKPPSGNAPSTDRSDTGSRSAPENLTTIIDKPFSRLEARTWLHDRVEKDVYKLLIDTYRLRMEDNYVFEGDADQDSIYGGAKSGLKGFRRFLRTVNSRAGLLPPWWSAEKAAECEVVGKSSSGWSSLSAVIEKSDLIEHYRDSMMPMQLRMFGEQVYGRGPGGQNGTAMRRQMMMMEGRGLGPEAKMSLLSLA